MANPPTCEALQRRVLDLQAETDRHRSIEKHWQESEARFRRFMDQCPALIYIKDDQLRHLYGNATLLQQLGTTLAAFEGTRCGDFFPPEVAQKVETADAEVLACRHLNVLENTGWRIRGEHGAASILDLKPTTLEARMKKLGIQRSN